MSFLLLKHAVFSTCGRYRYGLWRTWAEELPIVLFVGLNPSVADAVQLDPTIRRCLGFAKEWGFGGMRVGNLFGWRTPYPKVLWQVNEPIGGENDDWLKRLSEGVRQIVVCWGNGIDRPFFRERCEQVLSLLPAPVHHLGLTKQQQPRHPLYLKATTQPQLYDVI